MLRAILVALLSGLSIAEPGSDTPLRAGLSADGAIIVTGRIVDAETGGPIEGVQVYISAANLGSLTGSDGAYVLLAVPDGSHRMTIQHHCYHTVHVEIEYSSGDGQPRRVDVGLPFKQRVTSTGYSEPLGGCEGSRAR